MRLHNLVLVKLSGSSMTPEHCQQVLKTCRRDVLAIQSKGDGSCEVILSRFAKLPSLGKHLTLTSFYDDRLFLQNFTSANCGILCCLVL